MPVTNLVPPPPGLTNELLLEFFLVFSRFEYAMKAAGWTKPKAGAAEPDWQRLINVVNAQDATITRPLLEAGAYLLSSPPKEQIRRSDGSLEWSPVRCDDDARLVACMLWGVKRVRNNLFHGGKFELLGKLSPRNWQLVESSLRVLERLLEVPVCEPIRRLYFEYVVEQA